MTHTFAILEVSPSTFQEIWDKLVKAGYEDQLILVHRNGEKQTIDMHGIALQEESKCQT